MSDANTDTMAQTMAKKCATTILRAIDIDPDKSTVMEYACGTGLLSQLLAEHTGALIGVDTNPQSVASYNERAANRDTPRWPEDMSAICVELKERGQVHPDPFRYEFRVIICANAYYRFEDINAVTKVLASYLKPDYGVLVVIDLVHSSISESFHEEHGHAVVHKGGFKEEAIRDAFDGADLNNFSFRKAFDMPQGEKNVEFFIATGWV